MADSVGILPFTEHEETFPCRQWQSILAREVKVSYISFLYRRGELTIAEFRDAWTVEKG
jgi:hypothetical protein